LPYRRNPLSHWIISTAIASDTSSEPSEALRFFLDPIKQQCEGESSGVLPVVRKLSILHTRFELQVLFATDINWPEPFSTDFSFWESIQGHSAWDLAKSNTKHVKRLYSQISVADLLRDSKYTKGIEKQWSAYSLDILACLNVDRNVAVYVIDLAEVRRIP
jgi:hypothetical protein